MQVPSVLLTVLATAVLVASLPLIALRHASPSVSEGKSYSSPRSAGEPGEDSVDPWYDGGPAEQDDHIILRFGGSVGGPMATAMPYSPSLKAPSGGVAGLIELGGRSGKALTKDGRQK